MQVDDILSNSLVGQSIVGSDGTSTIDISLLNDNNTEGTEQLTLTVNNVVSSISVNDTSIAFNFADLRLERNDSSSTYSTNGIEGRTFYFHLVYSEMVIPRKLCNNWLKSSGLSRQRIYFDESDLTNLTGSVNLYSANSYPNEEGLFFADGMMLSKEVMR